MDPEKDKFSIVFLGTQMEVAGAQRMLLSQANWFYERGYPVKAVFFYDKQNLFIDWQAATSFQVISLEAWKQGGLMFFNLLRLLRGLFRLFLNLRDNRVIIAFTPHSNLLALPIAWIAKVPLRIGTHHGYIEGSSSLLARIHGSLTKSRFCSRMVAVSAQVRDYAIQKEGAPPEKLVIIENGIEPMEIKSLDSERRKTLRSEIGVDENKLLFLTVGRLTIQKGHTVLLDAIAKLDVDRSSVVFAFAGGGPQLKTLEDKTRQLGIADKVRYLGIRRDINELLLIADIFVQPSLWEGLSLALLEALFAGLPVVATRVEGVVDVVEDGVSALLVPPNDSESLANAINKIVLDSDLRKKLSQAGKQRAEGKYSLEKMCLAYEKLILDLAKNAA